LNAVFRLYGLFEHARISGVKRFLHEACDRIAASSNEQVAAKENAKKFRSGTNKFCNFRSFTPRCGMTREGLGGFRDCASLRAE
jgi:hypothetical protein